MAGYLLVADAGLPPNLSHFAVAQPLRQEWRHLAGGLRETLVDVQGELQCWEGAGGLDEVAGVAGQAGQHVVDHRRVGRAGVGQVDGLFPLGGDFGEGGRALAGEPGAVLEYAMRAGFTGQGPATLTEVTPGGEQPINLPDTGPPYAAAIGHTLACLTGDADNLIDPASALPALELTLDVHQRLTQAAS